MVDADGGRSGHATRLRESYVDAKGLDSRAGQWMELLAPYRRHIFDPQTLGEKPLLLVMDMQRFFLEERSPGYLPASTAIMNPIQSLVQAFRDRRHHLVFTRHVDRPGLEAGPMGRWWGHLLGSEDRWSDLHPDLGMQPREILFVKQQYSAFYGTRLEQLLKRLRIDTIVITGVMTHLCCESTARDAFMRGFKVVAVVDGMASLNEELHLSSLRTLVHGFAVPVLYKDLMNCLA